MKHVFYGLQDCAYPQLSWTSRAFIPIHILKSSRTLTFESDWNKQLLGHGFLEDPGMRWWQVVQNVVSSGAAL